MKKRKYRWMILFILSLLLSNCKREKETTICVHSCPVASPWTVESLDLGLPCFATKNDCIQWAASHGYGDKQCVTCNY